VRRFRQSGLVQEEIGEMSQAQFMEQDSHDAETCLDDLQSMFIRNVQHELRTPLAIIQGYVEVLHAGDLGPLATRQQNALCLVMDHVHELWTMVERITTLMAVAAHATAALPTRLDEIAEALADGRRTTAEEAGLVLEMCLEPDLPTVVGDPYQMYQAIDCLLENAIKFTPEGGQVQVQVYAELTWVCLAVTDSGIGMTPDDVERVLTRHFFQVDGSTTRRNRGFGLGLTLVRAIVEEHGGRLEVISQLGQGSRFTIKLPLPTAFQMETTTGDVLVPHRVLIVDDEEIVAMTLQEGLAKLPHCEISTATNSDQALRMFEHRPFDLLITDYKLPGTDGMTLATQVRQRYPQTVIIMITAYGDQELRDQAARACIRHILDKPVAIDQIRRVTLEAFSQPEQTDGS
jgi:CheY-like chemotaxis protein/nitrogen-specific signal transduction histidine kinase